MILKKIGQHINEMMGGAVNFLLMVTFSYNQTKR